MAWGKLTIHSRDFKISMKAALTSLLSMFPLTKRILNGLRKRLFVTGSVSSNYVPLQREEVGAEGLRLRNSWRDEALPLKQREVVEESLKQYRSGEVVGVFDVFVKSLRDLPDISPGTSLLEIGCSSGFYSEVVKIARLPITYSGCDYSEAFIRLAIEKYPGIDFSVTDATSLNYLNSSFDVVVSGCCILHIPEYKKAVAEAARVAKRYVIFHRTPVVWGQPEQWYRKQAYGVETVEIHFNESEFLALLAQSGLELTGSYTLSEEHSEVDCDFGRANRTYVCKKLNV